MTSIDENKINFPVPFREVELCRVPIQLYDLRGIFCLYKSLA